MTEQPGADVHEVSDDIVLDMNADGELVGIEIQNVSRHIDLSVLEIGSLPLKNLIFAPPQAA